MNKKPIKNIPIALAIVERHDGKLLFIKRNDHRERFNEKWEFPGGKIEIGETTQEAAARELLEETGVAGWDPESKVKHVHDWHFETEIHRVTLHCHVGRLESQPDVRLDPKAAHLHRWLFAHEARQLPLLEANKAVLDKYERLGT